MEREQLGQPLVRVVVGVLLSLPQQVLELRFVCDKKTHEHNANENGGNIAK